MVQVRDPVMLRFRAALDAAFGDRIERVVLFGSRARGDHRPDSDYDVAVFLRDYDGFDADRRHRDRDPFRHGRGRQRHAAAGRLSRGADDPHGRASTRRGRPVTPEAGRALDRAREDLRDAHAIAALPLARVAARSACYAMFHAAEALIFERTGKGAKTHRGVRSEFARLTQDLPTPDRSLTGSLARAYDYKELAD